MQLRDRRRQQTHREIVDTATRLFLEQGFEQVTVDTIAARCGISRATFFNYFPSKEHLLNELLLVRLERVREALARIQAAEAPALGDLTAMFIRFGGENEALGDTARQVLLAMLTKPACRDVQARMRTECLEAITRAAERMQARGALRADADPRAVAEALFTIYIGTTFDWMLRAGPHEGWLAQSLTSHYHLLLRGLA